MFENIQKIKKKYTRIPEGVKASIWFTFCTIIQRGISVLTVPIFTRLLSTDQYGIFNVFNSWYGIISIFMTLNLSWSAYTVALAKNEEDSGRLTSSLQNIPILLSGIGTIILLLGSSYWEDVLGLSGLLVFLMFVEMAFVTPLQLWSAKERFFYRYKQLILVTLLMATLSPLIGIVLISLTDFKAEARIISTVIVNAGFGIFFYIKNQRIGKVFYNKKYWKFAFAFCIPLIPHYLAQTVLNQSDRIMIDRMVGSSETAIYSVAYSVASIFTIINTTINHSLTPWLYRQIRNNEKDKIPGLINILCVFVLGMNLMYICLAPEVISLFAPSSYHDAIWVIPPLALSSYLMFLYQLFIAVELYYEENKHVLWSSIGAAVLNVGLNFIFIRIYGYYAAGYTSLVCYIFYVIGHYFIMNQVTRKHDNKVTYFCGRFILAITLLGLTLASAITVFYDLPVVRYISVVIILIVAIMNRKLLHKVINKILNKTSTQFSA